jgi:hypothetical protein
MSLEFFRLPLPVARRRELTAADKLVYAGILTRSGPNGFCRVGRARLARDMGLSTSTVTESIGRLEAGRYVAVERHGRGKTNTCRPLPLSPSGTENVPVPQPQEAQVRKPDAGGTENVPEVVRKADTKRKIDREKKSAAAPPASPTGGGGPPLSRAIDLPGRLSKALQMPRVVPTQAEFEANRQRQLKALRAAGAKHKEQEAEAVGGPPQAGESEAIAQEGSNGRRPEPVGQGATECVK